MVSHCYIDPAINANSGTGTIGDPYGDLQYALDTEVLDTAAGNQFNIKAGTDEIMTAPMDFSTLGTFSVSRRLIFRGYTAAANDGGIGGISGNGSVSIVSTSSDGMAFIDLHCHNSGSTTILAPDRNVLLLNCEFDNTSGSGVVCSNYSVCHNCYFHDIGNIGLDDGPTSLISNSFFENGTKSFVRAVSTGGHCRNLAISIDGASDGILMANGGTVENCSILSNGGTGNGIRASGAPNNICGNIIEGFSGSGGYGINFDASDDPWLVALNAFFNCDTELDTVTDGYTEFADNESLAASAFSKSGTLSWANWKTYFAPVAGGNVLGGMATGQDKGAIQSVGGGSGSSGFPMSRIVN